MPHKHRKGFNRDDNDFGRNKDFDIPDGEPALESDGMPQEDYPDNAEPIPDEHINID
jgi:hypothetical protein